MLIIDGFFQQRIPIRHKEILEAMAAGSRVVGAASMGALRAAELHTCGMKGIGEVFHAYRTGDLTADDEVAVAHQEDGSYAALSEPLVNIRHALTSARKAAVVSRDEARALLHVSKSLPYYERTWPRIARCAEPASGGLRRAVDRVLEHLARVPAAADLKRQDALRALSHLRDTAADCPPSPPVIPASALWRTNFAASWEAHHRGETALGTHVSYTAVLCYHQVFQRSFARSWREYVLRNVAGPREGASFEEVETAALQAARRAGISVDTLPTHRLAHWLTKDELLGLDEREQLLRLLVRSYRVRPGAAPFTASTPALRRLVGDWPTAVRRVVTHTDVADASGRRESPDSADTFSLCERLVGMWEIDTNAGRTLTAAARDRGLPTVRQALNVLRAHPTGEMVE
ncbi:TfuA-like protein [Streptomyces aurantiacus]|uniref:TfuA-like protein n=1 Tax=Streptomyces aurantiacus TaxID=47760 RepID=UPI0003F90324|nr:TfuA-like protein [Streptomyces aurantiacus]